MVSPEVVERYERDGFVVIEGFAHLTACSELRDRAVEIVEQWQPTAERTVFTTDEQKRTSNREFFESASSTWCFFEPGAFDDAGELRQGKALSINKIGHAMHDIDPVFERFSYTSDLADVAASIGIDDALAVQSMYIFKQPHIGGEVGCHQDSTFLYTDPIPVVGFWFAIEDATVDNGCLWAAPGGHRSPLRQRFERVGASIDDGVRFEVLDPTPLPEPPSELVPLEVPAGTLVVLHGRLPHWSGPNTSDVSRHAYSLHCIDGSSAYPTTNWLQRPDGMPFRSLRGVAESVGVHL